MEQRIRRYRRLFHALSVDQNGRKTICIDCGKHHFSKVYLRQLC